MTLTDAQNRVALRSRRERGECHHVVVVKPDGATEFRFFADKPDAVSFATVSGGHLLTFRDGALVERSPGVDARLAERQTRFEALRRRPRVR